MGRLIGKYLKGSWGQVFATVLFTMLQYGIQIFLLLPESKRLIDNGVAEKNMDAIWKSIWIMLALTAGVGICALLTSYFSARVTADYTCRLRNACFRKVEELTPQDFAAMGESTLVTRTMTDVTQMQQTVINMLRLWLLVPVMIVLELIMIATMDLTIFFILFGFFAVTVGFLVYFGASSRFGFEKLQQKLDRINLLMKERITGVRPVRAFGNEELESRKTEEANQDAYETAIVANRKINFLSPVALVLMSWVVVIIYLVGTSQIQKGMTSISNLLLIFQYVTFFITSLMAVPFLVNMMPKTAVSSRRINELLEYQPSADVEWRSVGAPAEKKGRVEFKDVIFGYAGAVDVIANISFTAEEGKITAMIGSTGSGKTTILNLMQGLYQPTFGDILIDGVSIRGCKDPWLRDYFSYGTQRPMIFQDTVRNNICPDPSMQDEARIQSALDSSCFREVLADKPEGIDFMMTQGGMNVSGGQRQRLSLARVFAKDARIYVFDDTLSALDAKTEQKVLDAIRSKLEGKTVLLVAQKISTVRDADHIIVMDKGRIAGQGTHDELLQTCQAYREIYETQCYLDKEGE